MFTEDDIPEPSRIARATWLKDFGGAAKLGSADTYFLNCLNSAATWLQSRALTVWARNGSDGGLMKDYAATLLAAHNRLGKIIALETMRPMAAVSIVKAPANYFGGARYDEDRKNVVISLDGDYTLTQLRAAIAIINAEPIPKENNDEL